MKNRPNIIIGIDPGQRTGLSLFSVEHSLLTECLTLDFWAVYKLILNRFDPNSTLIVLEDASLNKATFRKGSNPRTQDRLCRNVGMVQRESQLLAEGLERAGYLVLREKPMEAKWDEPMFRRVTGYRGSVTQHAIDAAKLCYGLTQWPVEVRVRSA